MLEVFSQEFSFLNLLSVAAFITTVGLFFCGIPICRQIWKRKDTKEISGAPFIMGVLGGCCWLTYGYLKGDHTVMYVTSAQVVLYSSYVVFYFFMTRKKFWISVKIIVLVVTCASLVAMVHFFGHKVFHPLGIICMTLNTADFAAPLAGLRVVMRRKATSTLPLPLCIANFMVSSEWFVYGLMVKDFYLITPNGIGSFLAFCQLILFVVLPRKPNQQSPIIRLYDFIRRCVSPTDSASDIEKASVVPIEKDTIFNDSLSKKRWSSRVISNVAGEIESVMAKVHITDQFAYSNRLNHPKEEDLSGDSAESITLTPENTLTQEDTKQMIKFPLTVRNEAQLMQLSHQLSTINWKRDRKSEAPPSFIYSYNGVMPSVIMAEDEEGEALADTSRGGSKEIDSKRWKSVPNLSADS